MKFQNPSMHSSKVTGGAIKSVTLTNTHLNNMPRHFFQVGCIMSERFLATVVTAN